MADFKVEVIRIDDVVKHPDADTLWIVCIRGFRCIFAARANEGFNAGRNEVVLPYNKGDLVAYIPEGSVLPEELLKSMDFWKNGSGTLAGTKGNRVKAVRLRGVVSQGILYRIDQDSQRIRGPHGNTRFVNEGDDVAEFLGVTKYEPPVPIHMAGEVCNIGQEYTLKYDIENIQKFPDIFDEGELVSITEKLHGTFCCLAYDPTLNHPDLYNGKFYTFSKGLGSQGLVFKNNQNNINNIYQNTLLDNIKNFEKFVGEFGGRYVFFICGEIFGKGIQDLTYGTEAPEFRVFDVGMKNLNTLEEFFIETGTADWADLVKPHWKTVPELYRGMFSKQKLEELRDGMTILGGVNIREGVVIKPIRERYDMVLGRVILKAVSPDYLLRKGNVTEYN